MDKELCGPCETCAHEPDSGTEHCGVCDGRNYQEAGWHIEERLKAENKKLKAALQEIKDGPGEEDSIRLTADYETGLFCGLEDRTISDRYEACIYGFEKAVERVSEWAQGIAEEALGETEVK